LPAAAGIPGGGGKKEENAGTKRYRPQCGSGAARMKRIGSRSDPEPRRL